MKENDWEGNKTENANDNKRLWIFGEDEGKWKVSKTENVLGLYIGATND